MTPIAQFRAPFDHVYTVGKVSDDEYRIDIKGGDEGETYQLHRMLRVGDSGTFAVLNVSDAHQTDVQSIAVTLYEGGRSHMHANWGPGTQITRYFEHFEDAVIEAARYEVACSWDRDIAQVKFVRI